MTGSPGVTGFSLLRGSPTIGGQAARPTASHIKYPSSMTVNNKPKLNMDENNT